MKGELPQEERPAGISDIGQAETWPTFIFVTT
jgi:hypothetical protein